MRGEGGEWPGGDRRDFTGRETELACFQRLADGPTETRLPVQMFHGASGSGKSWLLRRLQREAGETPGLPVAYLDLDPDTGHAHGYTDSASALSELRRQLNVPCPRFDLAYLLLRRRLGEFSGPLSPEDSPEERAGKFVAALAEAASTLSAGDGMAWLADQFPGPGILAFSVTPLGRWLRSPAGQADLLEVRTWDDQRFYPALIERLTDDLVEHLPEREGKACRAVVFLDGYSAPTASVTGPPEDWVRYLALQLTDVLLVLGGRNPLPWPEIDDDWRDVESLEQHRLAGLPRPDATRYLLNHGITDQLQAAVLAACAEREAPGPGITYHPFSLGLCVDTVVGERRTAAPEPESFRTVPGDLSALAGRFLQSLPADQRECLLLLTLTPRFDLAAAQAALDRVQRGAGRATWESLFEFSFILPSAAPAWWAFHPLFREALQPQATEVPVGGTLGHREWRDYWSRRSTTHTDEAAALAWYHSWFLDADAALTAWKQLAKEQRAVPDAHQQVLGWWLPLHLEQNGPQTCQEAVALNDLAVELSRTPRGNREANLERTIACYQAALRVFTEREFPREWASAQNNLGNDYQSLTKGDRSENLRRAITCYEAALRVYTEREYPREWASVQNSLGRASASLLAGDRDENLRRAVACYGSALRVLSAGEFSETWAETLLSLGDAYQALPSGDREENRRRAISCYHAALRVYTPHQFPARWADLQRALGRACQLLRTGDRSENLRAAISHYEAALQVLTERDFPEVWARVQYSLALLYQSLPTGDRDANLRRAIAGYEAALPICNEHRFPAEWATTQYNLALAYAELPSGNRAENMFRAMECCQAALHVYSEFEYPHEFATVHNHLGRVLAHFPAGNRQENLRWAIECFEAALRVYTESDHPREWARTLCNLGGAFQDFPDLSAKERSENLSWAIGCYQAALRVYTERQYPHDWATCQHHLGLAYTESPHGDPTECCRRGLTCFHSALRVFTEHDFPREWTNIQFNMGRLYHESGDPSRAVTAFQAATRGYRRLGDLVLARKAEAAVAFIRG